MQNLWHATDWSLSKGKVHELFLKDPLTLATWGLVLVTLLLVIDSWRKGNQQRKRWNREDEQHNQDRSQEESRWRREEQRVVEAGKPKYHFSLEIKKSEHKRYALGDSIPEKPAVLRVANFGLYGLYVESLFLKHRDNGDATLTVDRMVAPGNQLEFEVLSSFWEKVPGAATQNGNYVYGDHEVWLQISDINSTFVTDRILYYIVYMQRHFVELKQGSYEERQPNCPKCSVLTNLTMSASGLLTESEVGSAGWKQALSDLELSCPNHASAHLKCLGGPPDWFTNAASRLSPDEPVQTGEVG